MKLACDLGTANFRASVVGSDEVMMEPCVIARSRDGQITIGQQAHAMIGRNPEAIEVVLPVDGGMIRNIDAATEIIKHCANHFLSGFFGRRYTLTLSVPSGLTQVEMRALEDAGRIAGARSVEFVNACVAAAVGAGLPVGEPTGCLIVNLGGGVTEASLLSLNGVVATASIRSGGQAMNEAISDQIRKKYSVLVGLQMVESLKRTLCSDPSVEGYQVRGRDLKTGLPDSVFIPRTIVDEQLDVYSNTIVDLISQVISKCPPELAGDIIERGIVLVGGGANVQSLVAELTKRLEAPVIVSEEPETCVIRGLARTSSASSKRRNDANQAAFSPVSVVQGLAGQVRSLRKEKQGH